MTVYAVLSWFTCVSQRLALPAFTFECSSCLEAERLAANVELSRSGMLGADSRCAADAAYVAAGGPGAPRRRVNSAAPNQADVEV